MAFENQPNMLDKTYDYSGFKVFVDQASLLYLDGAEVDYVEIAGRRRLQVQQPAGEVHVRLRQFLPGLTQTSCFCSAKWRCFHQEAAPFFACAKITA